MIVDFQLLILDLRIFIQSTIVPRQSSYNHGRKEMSFLFMLMIVILISLKDQEQDQDHDYILSF